MLVHTFCDRSILDSLTSMVDSDSESGIGDVFKRSTMGCITEKKIVIKTEKCTKIGIRLNRFS